MNKILFAERLVEIRSKKNITQREFAKIYDKEFPPKRRKEDGGNEGDFTGIYGTIKKYENPNIISNPRLDIVANICKILCCDVDYLLGNIDEESHDVQFIHDETGLSSAAITVLKYANKKNIFTSPNQRILVLLNMVLERVLELINMILEKESKELESCQFGDIDIFNNLFTLMYDYIFPEKQMIDSSEASKDITVTSQVYGLTIMSNSYDKTDLLREVYMHKIREELDSFRATKKQGKKPC